MKRLILMLLLSLFIFSCKKECNFPPPPYGTPDDTQQYSTGDYYSINYVYYCKNFRYISVTYVAEGNCKFEKKEYNAMGVCKK